MGYIIDTTKDENINIAPKSIYEEVIQNLWFLYSSTEYDVPLDMELGLKPDYIDRPIEVAKALVTTDIYDKTEAYEPRATIVNIEFVIDNEHGIIKPIVEVEINNEYNGEDNEEYTE